jgi:hypothetical protein
MKTSEKQILQNGMEKSTYLAPDSPVSHSARQDEEKERMTTATYGRKLSGLYAKSSPLGLLVKMLVESPLWYNPSVKLKWNAKPIYSERITEKYVYGTGHNNLPEPPKEKILELIFALEKFTVVKQKSNLKRLLK